MAEAKLKEGIDFLNNQEYQQAIDCFIEAIQLKPDYADAYFVQGFLLNTLKNYTEAIDCYSKAIELKPDYADAYFSKGLSLQALQRYPEAIDCYSKAILLKPDYAEAYYHKGVSLNAIKRNAEAANYYREAMRLGPSNALFACSFAICLSNIGRGKEALEVFIKTKYLLKTQKKQDLNIINPHRDFVIETINKIIELETAVQKANYYLKQLDSQTPVARKLRESFLCIQEEKRIAICQINFEEISSTKLLDSVKEQIIKLQDEIMKVKSEQETLQVDDASHLVDDYQEELISTLHQNGHLEVDIAKITDYFTAFLETFCSCYRTSQAIENEQVNLDMRDCLSTLASFSPLFNDAVSTRVSKIEEFFATKEMKTYARRMLGLVSNSTDIDHFAGEVAYTILINPQIQKSLLQSANKNLNQAFENRVLKIADLCRNLEEDLDLSLYTRRYTSFYGRSGNNDANILIEVWLKGIFSEDEAKGLFLEIMSRSYNVIQDVSSPKIADTSTLKNEACTAFCNLF